MNQPVTVSVVLPDTSEVDAGTLRFSQARGRETATFSYHRDFLSDPRAYSVDPALPLHEGSFHAGEGPLFGAMQDSAPDRWGQGLLRRAERQRARRDGRTPQTLQASDFLLGTTDLLRQGALRYRDQGGYLSAPGAGAPKMFDLPRLLELTDKVLQVPDTDEDLRDLVAAAGSLGGARPKAAVRDRHGNLLIAKFPRRGTDEWDVMAWERLCLDMAARAGMSVPRNELVQILGRNVLILDRFDRDGGSRIGYISAMTLLEQQERTQGISLAELGEEMSRVVRSPAADLRELFRRGVLGALVSNSDNHLRNHAFLRRRGGWELSPAFDINPDPERAEPSMPIVPGGGDLADAVDMADAFRLTREQAIDEVSAVLQVVEQWERWANLLRVPAKDFGTMRPAFDNENKRVARALVEERSG